MLRCKTQHKRYRIIIQNNNNININKEPQEHIMLISNNIDITTRYKYNIIRIIVTYIVLGQHIPMTSD